MTLRKPISVARSADESVLCYLKYNRFRENNGAGAKVTAATAEVQANLIDLQVNGAAEVGIGTYTGNSGADNQVVFADANIASIQGLLDALNGVAVGQDPVVTRWRAGLGDFRPQFVIGAGDGLVAAPANALLGEHNDGLSVLADSSGLASANLISLGLGTGRNRRGGGVFFPDHFESDYSVTTAGVRTPVRATRRRREEQPGEAKLSVVLTNVHVAALFATTKVVTVYDDQGNVLFTESLGAGTNLANADKYTYENPICVGPPGSPLFVEVSGTGGFTNGVCVASGFTRASGIG